MADQGAHPGDADAARPDVLVTVEVGAERGTRIVEVDHRQAGEPDPPIDLLDEPVDSLGIGDRIAGAPTGGRHRGRSRRDPRERRGRRSRRGSRPSPRSSSPACRRTRPSSRAPGSAPSSGPSAASKARAIPSASPAIPVSRSVPRCEPTWTLTKRAPKSGATRSSLARTATDRSTSSGSAPARFTRYEAWIASGPIPSSSTRARNAGSSRGGAARRRQAVGLSLKTWSVSSPISWARSTARTIPWPSGRWAPTRRPSGSMTASYGLPCSGDRRARRAGVPRGVLACPDDAAHARREGAPRVHPRRPARVDPGACAEEGGDPALPRGAVLHRGSGVPRDGGQPAPRAVAPRRRRPAALPRRRRADDPRRRRVPAHPDRAVSRREPIARRSPPVRRCRGRRRRRRSAR